jgi:hypothetical protein
MRAKSFCALKARKSSPNDIVTSMSTRKVSISIDQAPQLFGEVFEECLGLLQVGDVEAFDQPIIEFGEHPPGLVSLALLFEQMGRG